MIIFDKGYSLISVYMIGFYSMVLTSLDCTCSFKTVSKHAKCTTDLLQNCLKNTIMTKHMKKYSLFLFYCVLKCLINTYTLNKMLYLIISSSFNIGGLSTLAQISATKKTVLVLSFNTWSLKTLNELYITKCTWPLHCTNRTLKFYMVNTNSQRTCLLYCTTEKYNVWA